MPISHDVCNPFLSATLLTIEKPPVTTAGLRRELLNRLQNAAGDGVTRTVHKIKAPTFRDGGLDVGWIHYSETRSPPWYAGRDLDETHHHCIFVLKREKLIALAFSDPVLRNTIVADIRRQRLKLFKSLKLLTAKQINDGFVRGRVRTLWLSGAHRRTSTKADSKILTGLELEAALDPLEDQGYYFSSVRSTHDGLTFNTVPTGVVVGANPRNARVWIGPSKDWKAFISRVDGLIDAAATAIRAPSSVISPLPVLASPIDGIAGANEPYDMAIIVPEAVSAGAEDVHDEPWLHEFSDAARFVISPKSSSPSFGAEVFWGQESYGRMDYEFTAATDGTVSVKATALNWNNRLDRHKEILKICSNTDLLTVYFDTGHTFAQGHFYETRFRDARFENWQWAKLTGFAVDTEKPLEGKKLKIADIGGRNDTSLFGSVAKHWPNLLDGGAATGWLICDDGSMESADFIHFNDQAHPPRLSLIHVKGSGSAAANRGISVSDYEIVVGQAVKNLRYLDRTNIADKLASEEGKQISTAVWRDGARQTNRRDVIKALRQAGSNLDKAVYVFQPRVRKSTIETIVAHMRAGRLDHSDVRRLQQLDTLLLAARAECFGLGAAFHVIGEDDAGQGRPPRR
jgi:hypothetical protein